MGAYLAQPRTEKESEDGGCLTDGCIARFGVSSMQGWRQSMEDAHLACTRFSKGGAVYGVFDGHGGHAVSAWVSKNFVETLEEQMSKLAQEKGSSTDALINDGDFIKASLTKTFLAVDDKMRRPETREELKRLHEEIAAKAAAQSNDDSGGDFGMQGDDDVMDPTKMIRQLLGAQGGGGGKKGFQLRVVDNNGVERLVPLGGADLGGDDDDDDEDEDEAEEGTEDKPKRGPPKVEDCDEDEAAAASSSTKSKEGGSAASSATKDDAGAAPSKRVKASDDSTAASQDDSSQARGKSDGKEDEEDDDDDNVDDEDLDMQDVGLDASQDPDQRALLSPYTPEGCGATAVVGFVTPGPPRRLVVANAGDSRCVLSRRGEAIPMSFDHKPSLDSEIERIRKAGGHIVNGRVDGNLNLTRSLGDLFYKRDDTIPPEAQKITANPDVQIMELNDGDEFAILACDGIWDCLTSQQCVDFVRQCLFAKGVTDGQRDEPVLSKICEQVCDQCLATNAFQSEGIGCDNMTMMICQLGPLSEALKHPKPPTEVPQPHNANAEHEDDEDEA